MLKRRGHAVAELSHQLFVLQNQYNELLRELYMLKNSLAVQSPVYNIGIKKKQKNWMIDVSGNFYVIDASGISHIIYPNPPPSMEYPPVVPVSTMPFKEVKNEMVYSNEEGVKEEGREFYRNGHPHFYYNPYTYPYPYLYPYLYDDPYDSE
jgi:hypothetical protein